MTLTKQTPKAGRTKRALAQKQLREPGEMFFFDHAGFSYDPKTETAQQGKVRCARELAEAEHCAREQDWNYKWNDDWSIGNHRDFYGEDSAYADREPYSCEICVLRDSENNVLASLGCIDDADSDYRRVIEAELALEALDAIRTEENEKSKSDKMMRF